MKKLMNKSIALVSMITILFFACSKENPMPEAEHEPEPEPTEEQDTGVPEPTFEVQGYQIQQTADDVFQVSFQLSGQSDNVSFYSGQFGNDYQYRDGRVVDFDALNLTFSTSRSNPSNPRQENQFSVWISSDFDGDYTFENVTSTEAGWKDITTDFTLATATTMSSAGTKDIKGYRVDGKPLYIAFKYVYLPDAGNARQWRVNFLNLSAVIGIDNLTITDQGSGGWKFVNNYLTESNNAGRIEGGTTNPGAIFLANANNTTETNNSPGEGWAVSKALNLGPIDNGPDQDIVIKQIIDSQLTTYQHTYTAPGTYEVVFVATNVDENDEKKEVVRTIQVVIP